jgi:hypothetical protein
MHEGLLKIVQVLDFGIKYESDLAGSDHIIGLFGFRITYGFNLVK